VVVNHFENFEAEEAKAREAERLELLKQTEKPRKLVVEVLDAPSSQQIEQVNLCEHSMDDRQTKFNVEVVKPTSKDLTMDELARLVNNWNQETDSFEYENSFYAK